MTNNIFLFSTKTPIYFISDFLYSPSLSLSSFQFSQIFFIVNFSLTYPPLRPSYKLFKHQSWLFGKCALVYLIIDQLH